MILSRLVVLRCAKNSLLGLVGEWSVVGADKVLATVHIPVNDGDKGHGAEDGHRVVHLRARRVRGGGEEPHDGGENGPQNSDNVGQPAEPAEFEPAVGVDVSAAHHELDGKDGVRDVSEDDAAGDDGAVDGGRGDVEHTEDRDAKPRDEDGDDRNAELGVDVGDLVRQGHALVTRKRPDKTRGGVVDRVGRDHQDAEEGGHENRTRSTAPGSLDDDLEEGQLGSGGNVDVLDRVEEGNRKGETGEETGADCGEERVRNGTGRVEAVLCDVDSTVDAGKDVRRVNESSRNDDKLLSPADIVSVCSPNKPKKEFVNSVFSRTLGVNKLTRCSGESRQPRGR